MLGLHAQFEKHLLSCKFYSRSCSANFTFFSERRKLPLFARPQVFLSSSLFSSLFSSTSRNAQCSRAEFFGPGQWTYRQRQVAKFALAVPSLASRLIVCRSVCPGSSTKIHNNSHDRWNVSFFIEKIFLFYLEVVYNQFSLRIISKLF